jgi:sec-independent protein translocase protein TatA
MNSLKPWHLLVLAIVFLILFGSKRLPDSARSLGRSLRIFKSEVQEMNKDDSKEDKKSDEKIKIPDAVELSDLFSVLDNFV